MAKRRPSGDGMVRKREDGRWEGRIVVGHKQNGGPIFRYVLAKTQKELLDKLHRDLNIFQKAAAKIDRSLGNEVRENLAQAEQDPAADFQPVLGRKRKSGSGCITQINDHLFEGRYSPTWPDGTRHAKNIYAKTRRECEKKLKILIQEMQAERQALIDQAWGIAPPDRLTKTQKKIWMYMRFHPDETNYSVIARGAGVTRHTAAKWYEMIREMVAGNLNSAIACPPPLPIKSDFSQVS